LNNNYFNFYKLFAEYVILNILSLTIWRRTYRQGGHQSS